MKLIGRQICLAFTPTSNICITKLITNYHDLGPKQAKLFDVYEYDQELFYKLLGEPLGNTYGKDVNTLVSNSEYWTVSND
jgi:hypothetical protein